MDNKELIETVTAGFKEAILVADDSGDMVTLTVESGSIIPVLQFLKEKMGFGFLTDVCGIHYPDQTQSLGVVYHMHNMVENVRIRLKTFVSAGSPHVATASNLFPSANWQERETYDFYGILFDGHPNLKRILNVEYLDYFPLRKEYPLEDPTRHDKDDRFFGR